MNYFVARGGQQHGPYALPDLKRMIADGSVSPSDLAWTEGMANWAPLSQILPADPAPPPPAYAPPPPAPAQPYVQPGYAPAAAGPVPPALHWALVLVLGMFTFGLFSLVWIFIEASFVKRIDPRNPSRTLFIFVILLELGYVAILTLVMIVARSQSAAQMLALFGVLVYPVCAICALVAIFKMRSSLVNYYNTVEPIQLRLSGVMTFFFNIYYFQHHFTRIAEWKKTGQLTPQA